METRIDVINIRAKDFISYQNNSSSIELLEENLNYRTNDNAQYRFENFGDNNHDGTSSYINFSSNLTDK